METKTWAWVVISISVISISIVAIIISIFALVLSGTFKGEIDYPMGDKALQAIDSFGFSNGTITGMKFIGCAKDDDFGYSFTAINQNGKRVDGIVCCGFLKRCTVRI